jgi:hypothetical protein
MLFAAADVVKSLYTIAGANQVMRSAAALGT